MIAETRPVALFSIIKIPQGGLVLFYQKHGNAGRHIRPTCHSAFYPRAGFYAECSPQNTLYKDDMRKTVQGLMRNTALANFSQQAALLWSPYHTFPIHAMTYISFRPP